MKCKTHIWHILHILAKRSDVHKLYYTTFTEKNWIKLHIGRDPEIQFKYYFEYIV